MAIKSREAYTRYYRHALRSDPDFQEFCRDHRMQLIYVELMLHDWNGASGIHVINPDILAAELLLNANYLKTILNIPNPLFAFNNLKNIIWLKKYFFDKQRQPGGTPGTFIRCIVNEYEATKVCVSFWKGFFETNQETLNKFYLDKFDKDLKIWEKGGELNESRTKALKAIQDLFIIKQRLFGEKERKEISFSIDVMMTV